MAYEKKVYSFEVFEVPIRSAAARERSGWLMTLSETITGSILLFFRSCIGAKTAI